MISKILAVLIFSGILLVGYYGLTHNGNGDHFIGGLYMFIAGTIKDDVRFCLTGKQTIRGTRK